jgi:hypothetical protein
MLMCRDALERRESCGGHFRSEYQTREGEALRDDEHFAHVAAWSGPGDPMAAHTGALEFERAPRDGATSEADRSPPHAEDLASGRPRRGHFESHHIDELSEGRRSSSCRRAQTSG